MKNRSTPNLKPLEDPAPESPLVDRQANSRHCFKLSFFSMLTMNSILLINVMRPGKNGWHFASMTFSNAISSQQITVLWWKYHWILFPIDSNCLITIWMIISNKSALVGDHLVLNTSDKSLPEAVFTKFQDAIWHHISLSELIYDVIMKFCTKPKMVAKIKATNLDLFFCNIGDVYKNMFYMGLIFMRKKCGSDSLQLSCKLWKIWRATNCGTVAFWEN